MASTATTVEDYLKELPEERQTALNEIRNAIKAGLPEGFQEGMGYGMICYSVPHSTYPNGYHCNPKQPLPFISVASQKNFIALYHMGMYADADLLQWFTDEYAKHAKFKLDMGKSCVRFKRMDDIPHALITALASKMSPADWIARYEKMLNR